MKAKISYIRSLFSSPETVYSVVVYGKNRAELLDVVYSMEKSDLCIVTNLYIIDDEVKENVEN